MVTFADTSALYALLDRENVAHEVSAHAWAEFRRARDEIVTTNYVILEAVSLLQNRLGLNPVRDLVELVVPLFTVQCVGWEVHGAALAVLLTANRRDLSLVDCASFEVMRRLGIRQAFTLDEHFREQGFEVVP
jgi:predicted nucleic acid-binding protein